MGFLKDHPTIGGAILSLLGAILGIFINNPELVASLVGMAAVFFGLHQIVSPVSTMATKMTEAATKTATQVVAGLDQTAIGTVTEVTDTAQSLINNTVNQVVPALLGKKAA